jgi:hypothetical protein
MHTTMIPRLPGIPSPGSDNICAKSHKLIRVRPGKVEINVMQKPEYEFDNDGHTVVKGENTTLYPHEVIIRDIKKYLFATGVIKMCFIALGFGMLILSTAATTILLLALPKEPQLINGVLAGMVMTGFIGLGVHLMVFEPTTQRR